MKFGRSTSRRDFVASCLAASAGLRLVRPRGERLPEARAITKGPRFHWFGYYDKLQFDPTGRYCLSMQVDFEHRSPTPDDEIRIGMVDLAGDDKWIELGRTRAWCWQQGCMLQWRPGSKTEILYNDREDNRFVCRVVDVKSGASRTIPSPIYTVAPDGRFAMTLDFARVQDMRPGYGYAGIEDVCRDELAPEASGISRVDLDSGASELVVPLAEIAAASGVGAGAKHYFNHLLSSSDGKRFVFLHRWRPKGARGFRTQMWTADPDGSARRLVDASGYTSHFIWRDPSHILAWSRVDKRNAFWLFDDKCEKAPELVGDDAMPKNGHCSYLPGNEWILNDTYPDAKRRQHPYLYHVESRRRVALGHFVSPKQYRGEWRCDTHPRFSPDGKKVVIDSPHGGDGRQLWLIDIEEIVTG